MSYHCVLFFLFLLFFCSILWHTRDTDEEKGTHPHFDLPVSPYPWVDAIALTRWASASATADELAKQLLASASGLTVPPPAASTAEAVDLSAGAAIGGLLLLLLLLLLRRVQASSPAKKLNAGVTCIVFSIYRVCL